MEDVVSSKFSSSLYLYQTKFYSPSIYEPNSLKFYLEGGLRNREKVVGEEERAVEV